MMPQGQVIDRKWGLVADRRHMWQAPGICKGHGIYDDRRMSIDMVPGAPRPPGKAV